MHRPHYPYLTQAIECRLPEEAAEKLGQAFERAETDSARERLSGA